MFEQLDFLYLPSRDVAADVEHFTGALGAELVFAIEAFDTRVAMVRLNQDPPALLLAGHLEGEQPVLVYRVFDLEQSIAELEARGVRIAARFDIPTARGPSWSLRGPSGSRSMRSRDRKRPAWWAGGTSERAGADIVRAAVHSFDTPAQVLRRKRLVPLQAPALRCFSVRHARYRGRFKRMRQGATPR